MSIVHIIKVNAGNPASSIGYAVSGMRSVKGRKLLSYTSISYTGLSGILRDTGWSLSFHGTDFTNEHPASDKMFGNDNCSILYRVLYENKIDDLPSRAFIGLNNLGLL